MNSIFLWQTSFRRHWGAALGAFILVLVMTAIVILYFPREYRSVSRLLLRVGHESATVDPTVAGVGDPNLPVKTSEDAVETEIDVMHSRAILEDVVERLGHEPILEDRLAGSAEEPPSALGYVVSSVLSPMKSWAANIDPISPRERAVRTLELGLDISASEKSSLVMVEYKAEDPRVAQVIVEAWVEVYLAHHARVNRTRGTYDFFLEQDVHLRKQLDEVRQQIREAKSKAGFTTLAGQQKLLETQLEKVSTELFKVEADLVESSMRADTYAVLLDETVERTVKEETTGVERELYNDLRGQLFTLEVLENEFASKYTDSHPKLISIREQLSQARRILDEQTSERVESRELINPTHQQLFENRIIDLAMAKSLFERKNKLEEQRASLLAEMNALNDQEEQLTRLERNAKVLDERFSLHSVMLEQARLNEELEENHITSINVAQPATLEERPVSPNKKLCALAGLMAAMGLALGVPVLLDFKSYMPAPAPAEVVVRERSLANLEEATFETAGLNRRVRPSVAIRVDSGESEPHESESDAPLATRPR